jgi:hypothetical protein
MTDSVDTDQGMLPRTIVADVSDEVRGSVIFESWGSIIHNDHVVTRRHRRVDYVRSDETRPAGDKNSHNAMLVRSWFT